jgi:hypothetical protein
MSLLSIKLYIEYVWREGRFATKEKQSHGGVTITSDVEEAPSEEVFCIKRKMHPCTGTEALYRPYGKVQTCTGTGALYRPYGKVHPCTGTEALYRPYGKVHPCTGTEALYRPYGL